MAEQGVTVADLDELRTVLGPTEICISLQFFARYLRSIARRRDPGQLHRPHLRPHRAVKDYSNMDRAPILEVDVPAGLDATLADVPVRA